MSNPWRNRAGLTGTLTFSSLGFSLRLTRTIRSFEIQPYVRLRQPEYRFYRLRLNTSRSVIIFQTSRIIHIFIKNLPDLGNRKHSSFVFHSRENSDIFYLFEATQFFEEN